MDAFKRGYKAAIRGKWINENPFIYGSDNWEDWRKGWKEYKGWV